MSDLPLVSVILPTFNRAALLRRSILSVLAQTYRDFELIVVDDCSTDATADVVREFGDPRLRYIRRQTNGRAARARNDGLAAARGSLLAFQDDDDVWLPHKLERQVAALQQAPDDVGLLLCAYIRWHRWGISYIGGKYYERRLDFSRGRPGSTNYGLIATPAWLLRRSWLDRVGNFDPGFRSWDDLELGLRLWKVCRLVHLDEPLFIQDQVLGSAMMADDRGRMSDMKLLMEKHGALWEKSRVIHAEHCFFIGRREVRYGSVTEGRAWLRRALAAWPLHLRALLVLGLSFLPAGARELIVFVLQYSKGMPLRIKAWTLMLLKLPDPSNNKRP